mgnify:FL=1
MTAKRKLYDNVHSFFIGLSALAVSALSYGMIVYVLAEGLRYVSPGFLTHVTSVMNGTTGVAGNIVNTLYIIAITLVTALPLGVGSAIFLNEYAKKGRLVRMVEFTTETLAGIPSIIFGLFGMVFFGELLKLGYSILTGSLTLSLMILPLITRSTQEALKAVPDSLRSGALGLGANKWYMIRTLLLPSAAPGIASGIILSTGRIVGESAALIFTAGSGYLLPRGMVRKIFESGGTLTVQLYLSMSKGQYDAAFAIAAILVICIPVLNLATSLLTGSFKSRKRGE